jgi:DNA-binding MarR family transcriptional regulator
MAERTKRHARLDDQLCFALYTASRAVFGAYRPMLAEIGLTYPQYLAMLALWERDGRTVAELGDALHLESSTMSPIIRRLEALGLVSKRRSTHDERVVHVQLTDAGWDLEGRVGPVREAVETSTGLTEDQFVALRHRLQTLREVVTQSRLAG